MLLAPTLSKKELMLRKFDYPSFQDLGLKACSSTLITPKIFLKDKWAASKGKKSFKNDHPPPHSPTSQSLYTLDSSEPLEFSTLFFSYYFYFVTSVLFGAC